MFDFFVFPEWEPKNALSDSITWVI